MKKLLLFLVCILGTLENLTAMTAPEPSATVTAGSGSGSTEQKSADGKEPRTETKEPTFSNAELVEQYIKHIESGWKLLQEYLSNLTAIELGSEFGGADPRFSETVACMQLEISKHREQSQNILSKISDTHFTQQIKILDANDDAQMKSAGMPASLKEGVERMHNYVPAFITKAKAYAIQFRNRQNTCPAVGQKSPLSA